VVYGHTEAVRLLLAAGADVTVANRVCVRVPCTITRLWGEVVIGVLIRVASMISLHNRLQAGKTALDLAQRVGNAEVVKLLSGVEDSPSPAATSCMLQ
jgi:ankyrin repeat protein